jgi:hypothetical protein
MTQVKDTYIWPYLYMSLDSMFSDINGNERYFLFLSFCVAGDCQSDCIRCGSSQVLF